MAHYYAQLDNDGVVVSVSDLAAAVNHKDMVPLDDYDIGLLGYTYNNGQFTPPAEQS